MGINGTISELSMAQQLVILQSLLPFDIADNADYNGCVEALSPGLNTYDVYIKVRCNGVYIRAYNSEGNLVWRQRLCKGEVR